MTELNANKTSIAGAIVRKKLYIRMFLVNKVLTV